MISDITLGQFFPGVSLIHRLDPRTKILIAVGYIVAVFLANNPVAFFALSLLTVILISISGIAVKTILKSLKPLIIILVFTALINVFLTKGESEPLLAFWVVKIYTEGIVRAVFMALRVILLIVGTSVLLTYTTSPISLTDGIESLLKPLKLIKVPVHLFAMMMTIALRFIPTLVEETEKIMNAQKSRGADFTSGGIIKRAKALIPILIPLFVSSFKRAEELATAMECRCYRGDVNRTKLTKLTFKLRDYMALFISLILIAALVSVRILPYEFELSNVVYDIIFYRI